MKKFILAVVAMVAMTNSQVMAQSEYAPAQGDFSTEVQFNPFSGDNVFSLDALKFRYFLTDQDALLLQLGLDVNTDKTIPDTDNDQYFSKATNGNFRIDLGYERHFLQAGRVDLFAGARLGYERQFASYKNVEKGSNGNGGTKDITTEISNNDRNGHQGGNAFNMDIFTGIDFYLYKGLYTGAELGVNLRAFSPCASERKVTDQDTV
ncbi:MAG: hypothetical protein K2L49_01945 [Muribaculaceae bacterium]|nr:hypothetical protein [Muribaculaceae bacterium]